MPWVVEGCKFELILFGNNNWHCNKKQQVIESTPGHRRKRRVIESLPLRARSLGCRPLVAVI